MIPSNLTTAPAYGTDITEEKVSQNDLKFMRTLERSIYQDNDKHKIMPLPFINRPTLPDNYPMALRRFKSQQRKFRADPKYFEHYKMFMDGILASRDAEQVPADQAAGKPGEVWYIPHLGVYHPKKPQKIGVVFDCSAKSHGTSPNDHLLQGPDQMNGLVGFLCRFRNETVGIIGDIERMFHQFKVDSQNHDFLHFLWFDPAGNIVSHRMKVHLFGATSLPGCATLGLRRTATDHTEISSVAAAFIKGDFYVDNGITSVATAAPAIKLISDTREICTKGGL